VNSDEAAGDGEGAEHASFIIMRADDTFDGQERVMSRAAYDLQILTTAHSASCGHPGFVPDDYLEYLDGLSIETTITAAELCTTGMWGRVDGGNSCGLQAGGWRLLVMGTSAGAGATGPAWRQLSMARDGAGRRPIGVPGGRFLVAAGGPVLARKARAQVVRVFGTIVNALSPWPPGRYPARVSYAEPSVGGRDAPNALKMPLTGLSLLLTDTLRGGSGRFCRSVS
jgi:hypothetical protein